MESVVIMNAFTDHEWTKVKEKSASKAPALFSPHDSIVNEWENNYAANGKGRIWLLWNPGNVQVTVLHTENQIIHSFIIDHSKSHLIAFSAIYELHTIEERKELWASIENLESSIHNPWLLMGDFNANLRGKDRNTTVMDVEIKDFENLMTNAGLHKLKTIGRFFTWTNSYVHSKLDKALVNGVWLRKWPHLEVEVTHFSDHSLLYVSVKEVAGGLSILDVAVWNKAVIGKLLWNIYAKKDKLWVQWEHCYYGRNKNLLVDVPKQASWVI
ncbi:hypothetical protein FXO38_29886 [Capsicum annuum]|nr:hypothetical protein FXO38_29886 [Capsicum annuum]